MVTLDWPLPILWKGQIWSPIRLKEEKYYKVLKQMIKLTEDLCYAIYMYDYFSKHLL